MTEDQIGEYLNSLKPGEHVIETGRSCMTGKKGVVYIGEGRMSKGTICVLWEGGLGTSATWGTRRLADACTCTPTDGIDIPCSGCPVHGLPTADW